MAWSVCLRSGGFDFGTMFVGQLLVGLISSGLQDAVGHWTERMASW